MLLLFSWENRCTAHRDRSDLELSWNLWRHGISGHLRQPIHWLFNFIHDGSLGLKSRSLVLCKILSLLLKQRVLSNQGFDKLLLLSDARAAL